MAKLLKFRTQHNERKIDFIATPAPIRPAQINKALKNQNIGTCKVLRDSE